jgi:multidrug efflux system membrane fusion protein
MSYHSRTPVCLGLTVLVLALAGCGPGASHDTGSPTLPVVRVKKPLEKMVDDYETFTGRTDAVESVEVRARVTGYLDKIDFTAGQEVKKDQRLFKIDPRPYEATYKSADAQVRLKKAEQKQAIADNARAQEVAKTPGAISKQDLDKYAAAESTADAAVAAATANADAAKLDVEFTDVKSPIDGLVGRNLLTIGNLVVKDTTLLTTVVSQDKMYAYFDVDERTMLKVQKQIREGRFEASGEGGNVPVEFGLATEGDQFPHKGTMDFVNNRVDASTGTIQIRGLFDNPKQEHGPRVLTPGLFIHVRVAIGPRYKALLVPQAAIGEDQSVKYVFVVNDQNVVEYRPIEVGALQPGGLQVVFPVKIVRTDKGMRLAKKGEKGEDSLTKDDQIIVTGLQRIQQGVKVEPKPYSPEQPVGR